MKAWLKRILIIFSAVCIFIMSVFSFRPYKTKADVLSAIALGTGALSAIVSAYFASSGIQFSSSSPGYNGSFLGNYISNWVLSTPSSGTYFNPDGSFAGSSEDLSVVKNNDNDLLSFVFGKEFTMYLEILKAKFVSDYGLTENEPTEILSGQFVVVNGYKHKITDYSAGKVNSPDMVVRLKYPDDTTPFRITFNENYYFSFYNINFSAPDRYDRTTVSFSYDVVNTMPGYNVNYTNSFSTTHKGTDSYVGFFVLGSQNNTVTPNSRIGLGFANYIDDTGLYYKSRLIQATGSTSDYYPLLSELDAFAMELTGELTEGYDDFADAINNDVVGSDDEDLVVGIGLGEGIDISNPSTVGEQILDKIVADTLDPTLEGVYDDQATAEEELEGEKPFVPELPAGWVSVEGIQSFFPFCIPWDFYYVINMLNVPAEAPRFTWKMNLGHNFEPYDIVIDLSDFEVVARVFRIMVVIGFLLFLILKTRDMIRG